MIKICYRPLIDNSLFIIEQYFLRRTNYNLNKFQFDEIEAKQADSSFVVL